ncbi:hypothetical protein [Streptomyces sp. NPDC056492]|uniref:hypothetical protein n=1 Tax=unclassified Streptomyces TaxID=2593676 RepID=UPI003673DCDE
MTRRMKSLGMAAVFAAALAVGSAVITQATEDPAPEAIVQIAESGWQSPARVIGNNYSDSGWQ